MGQVVDEATAKAWGLYEDQVVAMIHSGSRGLGHQVCTDHVRKLEASYKLTEGIWQNETWGTNFQTGNWLQHPSIPRKVKRTSMQ